MEAVRGSANLVTNIFCENALETALQLRDQTGGRITALTFAPESGEDSLRKALAMKVDEAVLVLNDGRPHPDPFSVATALAAAIAKLSHFDLIMTGRESGDWGTGQTGALLAELIGLPCVAFVDRIEATPSGLMLKRQTESGWEMVESQMPVVVTITNDEHNVPRVPKTRDVMMSFRQPLTRWTLDELEIDSQIVRRGNSYCELVDISVPMKDSHCEFIQGDSLESRVEDFALRLLEVKRGI